MDCTETASKGGTQDSGCFDSTQAQVGEVVRSPLQDHDRMSSGRRYCLWVTVYEGTKRGCRALPSVVMNSASTVDLMEDNLDVSKAVILEHIMTILYVGWHSAGEGLIEEEAEACVEHLTLMLNGWAWQWSGSSRSSCWLRVKRRSEPTKLKARMPSKGVGDLESLSLQTP